MKSMRSFILNFYLPLLISVFLFLIILVSPKFITTGSSIDVDAEVSVLGIRVPLPVWIEKIWFIRVFLTVASLASLSRALTLDFSKYFPTRLHVDIYFDEVEDILEHYGLAEEYKSTFGKAFQDLKDVDYEKLSTEINSEETFTIVKNIVEDILEKGVIPFLNRFTTLEEVANFIADKKFEETRDCSSCGKIRQQLVTHPPFHQIFYQQQQWYRLHA